MGDSDDFPAALGNLSDRPEVAQALAGGRGTAERYSPQLRSDALYVAIAVAPGGARPTVVRAAAALDGLDALQIRTASLALLIGAGALALALAGAILLAGYTTRSLAHLERIAVRLAAGDFNARAREGLPSESAPLASALNHMADRLSATIYTLRSEQALQADVLEHMADGLLIVDEHDAVIRINRAAADILHVGTGLALNSSFTQVVRDHEMASCLAQARATSREQTRVIEQSGIRRFLRMVATPLPPMARPPLQQPADEPRGVAPGSLNFLVVLQDLTQIRRLEAIRRDFISNVSHELRTPLASLQALVETLNDGALEDPPAARRFVARMEEEVHHLTHLVNDLLDLSALESGRTQLRHSTVDVGDIVRSAAARLEQQAERAGLTLRMAEAPVIAAYLDPDRIEQVVLNLIHNAIKFTPAGGQVECRVAQREGRVVISVRDTGIGISPGNLPRIFERFYKTDRSRAGGGTGLGLAIARHIVELHGGHIWAESLEGHGTTMIVSLPLTA